MQTKSGRKVYILDPKPEDVKIHDIAHALARICRFGGHVDCDHYSVAQHSVLVSETCEPQNALVGLLHDAAEAYIGDMVRPLKYALAKYREIEMDWNAAIQKHFALGGQLVILPLDVELADKRLLATERRDLMSDGPQHELWRLREPPLTDEIVPLSPTRAENAFMRRYSELCIQVPADRRW